MSGLANKLEDQIHHVIAETGREPSAIVMHPQTWLDLVREGGGHEALAINMYCPSMKYRGIKVLRSLDLLEGEFEI